MKPFLFAFFLLPLIAGAQERFDLEKRHAADSLKRWTVSVMDGVSKKHPGFYRYTSKEKFDALIDSTIRTIDDSLTTLAYYRKIKPLFAKIGCLHTGVSLPTKYQNYLDKSSTLLPLEVFIDSDRHVFITKNHSDHTLHVGNEIISINGKSIADILSTLLASIPSDGYNQTEKILLLNNRFAFWYQAVIEDALVFRLELKTNNATQVYELNGVTSDILPSLQSLEANYTKPLVFEIKDKVAILTVHTFAKSTIKESGQDFNKFIRRNFKQIKKEGIKNLVVDLRYNSGGTDGNAVFLATHFFDAPFRYWEKIEVTEALANEIKGINRLFYKKPVKEGDTYHWRKTWFTSEFDYYKTQKPSKHNFNGRTFLLVNGLCMSSCADFTAILSHNKKAIVVGQETGGGYQGNTSGMIPEATLPMGLLIIIPLQKYTNAVDPTKYVGHGTLPDVVVTPTLAQWMAKEDVEMKMVWKLVAIE